MTHAPAFAAAATLAWKVSMSGRPVCASPAYDTRQDEAYEIIRDGLRDAIDQL